MHLHFKERKVKMENLILVVDDDFSIVNIIETALKQAGYQVLTAHDGEAACHIVNTHPVPAFRRC